MDGSCCEVCKMAINRDLLQGAELLALQCFCLTAWMGGESAPERLAQLRALNTRRRCKRGCLGGGSVLCALMPLAPAFLVLFSQDKKECGGGRELLTRTGSQVTVWRSRGETGSISNNWFWKVTWNLDFPLQEMFSTHLPVLVPWTQLERLEEECCSETVAALFWHLWRTPGAVTVLAAAFEVTKLCWRGGRSSFTLHLFWRQSLE